MKPLFRADGDSFVIENYNQADAFASFFPGLAGEYGKPMWVFFTNRGQGISSFGVNNKDGAMLEFLPANKAYQATPILGFRTFIRPLKSKAAWVEPFQVSHLHANQTLIVRPYELVLKEHNKELDLDITVTYFGVPSENCPMLARSLEIKNTGRTSTGFNLLDGLPRIVPWGMGDFLVKNMSRTIEAFAEVINHKSAVPYFKLKVQPDDRPDIQKLHGGFFCFTTDDKKDLLPIIVDPHVVFAHDLAFLNPSPEFGTNGTSLGNQMTANIMPSSFSFSTVRLKPKETKTWNSYFGYAASPEQALSFSNKIKNTPSYFQDKQAEIKRLYENLVKELGIKSSNPIFDAYAKNTFMDNILRGGFPLSLGKKGPIVHVYSRKHGDMERDYNAFQISATYFSQGNGNFRDVNQNRRHDVIINPNTQTTNVDFFFNLLQLDGYNPLVINPLRFIIPRDLEKYPDFEVTEEFRMEYTRLKRHPVQPGEFYDFVLKNCKDRLNVNNVFLHHIQRAIPQQGVQHGEGFWVDHWTYNLDHLESYFSVYPDQIKTLLFEKKDTTYYDSDHVVRPRKEKYVVTKDSRFRQYGAVGVSQEKKMLIASRKVDANKVRTQNGMGDILKTSLYVKLLNLAVVKTSSLDPFGTGIEMEADRPGWCDALNGAPGLFGSSSHITFELIRLIKILKHGLRFAPHKSVEVPNEIASFLKDVSHVLSHGLTKDFRPVWDKLAASREHFREKTLLGVSGKMRAVKVTDIADFLQQAEKVLHQAEKRVIDPKTKLPTSYFTHEVNVNALPGHWRTHMDKIPFVQHRVPPFLEGAVHAMKMWPDQRAESLYKRVKNSELHDKKLGMYKLNVSLEGESSELGRIRVFSEGWLENESIFLHMHYKYLLEILRAGLVKEFMAEIKTGLIPFRDMKTYGRPIFENSSFLASSEFPKKAFHGKGFVARLSGATSEFLSMLYTIAFGPKLFIQTSDGNVELAPTPSLPGSWFTKKEDGITPKNSFELSLFGVPIRYENPLRKDTFGNGAVKPTGYEWIYEGRFYTHQGPTLPPEPSLALREGRLESLTITLNKPKKN